jgi:hypothetical protein
MRFIGKGGTAKRGAPLECERRTDKTVYESLPELSIAGARNDDDLSAGAVSGVGSSEATSVEIQRSLVQAINVETQTIPLDDGTFLVMPPDFDRRQKDALTLPAYRLKH